MGTAGPLRNGEPLDQDCPTRLPIILLRTPVISAIFHALGDRVKEWRTADRSSAGLLPPAKSNQGAVVRIFWARTVRWRGIIATHSWIVVKEANAPAYSRFDCTAWGEPIWIDRFVPDGRWFGRAPEVSLVCILGARGIRILHARVCRRGNRAAVCVLRRT
jgi:hypothetical protein